MELAWWNVFTRININIIYKEKFKKKKKLNLILINIIPKWSYIRYTINEIYFLLLFPKNSPRNKFLRTTIKRHY